VVFHSIKDIKKDLLNKIEQAVYDAGELVYERADEKLAQFYNEYEPDYYIRTNQLRDNSLSFSPAKKTNNGVSVEIGYIDQEINYNNGNTPLTVWNSMMGDYPHGGYEPAGGNPVFISFYNDLFELGYINHAVETGMRHAGIPAKRF
jgi:hypothetical protein